MKNLIDKSDKTLDYLSKSDVAYQMTMALSNLNGHYKNEINSYVKELQESILQIEKIKNEISLHEKTLEPQNKTFESLKHDVNYELLLLERLNNTFIQDSKLLTELNSFLEDSKDSGRFYEKKNALANLLSEIKDVEKKVLMKELEKENILLEMKPIVKKIEMLKYKLNEVELEKHFLESTKIHQIAQHENISDQKDESENIDIEEVIDTDVTSK
ncbi:Myosin heavy chain [hydrothermal vent metagenome]|uniref:Myosin heavy chain n=1 Tax=hydrothermal vent metagenome TaxID=652676 RepID=A0A1W1EFE7_9ZZZZ